MGFTVLVGVIMPDYQGGIGLLLHNGSKEEHVWNT
jgi:dUTPase